MNKTKFIGGTSLVLIVLALGRIFLASQKDKRKNEERVLFDGIRTNIQESKARSATSIDSLLKLQGRIYVYSNDPAVKAGWAPNLDQYGSYRVNSMINSTIKAEEFVKKKDSLGFLLLLNCGKKDVFPVNKGIRFDVTKGDKSLWFMGFDQADQLPKDSTATKQSAYLRKSKFVSTWGVGFNEITDLSAGKLVNLPMVVNAKYVSNVRGFKLYMIGYAKDNNHVGTDSLAFAKSIGLFNQALKEMGVDVRQFSASSF